MVPKISPRRTFVSILHLSLWREMGLLPVLAIILISSQLVPVSLTSFRWHGVQALVVETGGVILLAGLLCTPWPRLSAHILFAYLRQTPFLCLHLLLFWALISLLRDPNSFSVQGWLTIAFGILTADVVALQLSEKHRILFVVNSVLLAAVLVSLTGLIQIGNGNLPLAVGCLHDHQLFGAFVMLPISLCLALCIAPSSLTQRVMSQAVLLICIAGLWASQNRSAWLGLIASLAVFGSLCFYVGHIGSVKIHSAANLTRSRISTMIPVILILAAVLGLVWLSPDRDKVLARVRSVEYSSGNSHDSIHWREAVWAGTRQMIIQRPLWGWGIGSFSLRHEPFTHTGHTTDIVEKRGPSLEDETHNSYLQIGAELGITGLILWLGAFFSLIVSGIQAVRVKSSGSLEQWLLIGGLSGIAGQMVDALANPAWQFGNVALPLWIIFGMTAALTHPSTPIAGGQRYRSVSTPVRLVQMLMAAGIGFGLLRLIFQTAFSLPVPHL